MKQQPLRSIFWNSFKRPFSDWKKLLIGILIFTEYPFLFLLVGIPALGYRFAILSSTLKRKKKMPSWKNVGLLYVRGIKYWAVNIAYGLPVALLIIPVLLLLPFEALFLELPISNGVIPLDWFTQSTPLVAILGVLIVLLFLSASYLISPALVQAITEKKFSAIFNLKKVIRTSLSKRYFKSWALLELFPIFFFTLTVALFEPTIITIPETGPLRTITQLLLLWLGGLVLFLWETVRFTVYGTVLSKKRPRKKIK